MDVGFWNMMYRTPFTSIHHPLFSLSPSLHLHFIIWVTTSASSLLLSIFSLPHIHILTSSSPPHTPFLFSIPAFPLFPSLSSLPSPPLPSPPLHSPPLPSPPSPSLSSPSLFSSPFLLPHLNLPLFTLPPSTFHLASPLFC